MKLKMIYLLLTTGCLIATGCQDPRTADQDAQKKEREPVIGRTTDEIGEYDPSQNRKVSDGKMKEYNPLNPLGAMNAYKPAVEQIAKLQIKQAVELFNAANGRYPKDHQEFMEEVIQANKIQLAVLPGDWEYQYDVQNHELVVVESRSGN